MDELDDIPIMGPKRWKLRRAILHVNRFFDALDSCSTRTRPSSAVSTEDSVLSAITSVAPGYRWLKLRSHVASNA